MMISRKKMPKKESRIPNKQKQFFRLCTYIGIFFALIFLINILFFDAIGEWASPIIFLSIWLSLSSFGVSLIFKKRAKNIDNAISNSEIIAEWDIDKKEWETFKNHESLIRKSEKKAAFLILTMITIIVFVPFIIVIPEAKLVMACVGLFLIFFYSVLAFFIPFVFSKFVRYSDVKIVIMRKGVLIDNQYHTWDFPFSRLKKASVLKKPFNHISIIYSFFDRLGPRTYNIVLPIKNIKQAYNIVEKLNKNQ
jgi:hypothetical protein